MNSDTANGGVKYDSSTLYALLVGINEYRGDLLLPAGVHFTALSGGVADAQRMQAYLQQERSLNAKVKILANEQATKAEIVRQFQTHLGQAKAGDIALFYYSGHGAQELADPVWTSETDGKLESLACYYDEQTQTDFLLADKELRYLIHQLAIQQPHIVTLFDCCHSADNTRNGALVTAAFPKTVEKRVPFIFPQRDWSQFIFSAVLPWQQVQQQGDTAALPEGTHIQLSACESDEAAVESAGEGVFTKTLLRVLHMAGGEVSYQALGNRIRQYLRNVYEQKPRLYITPGHEAVLDTTFLLKPATNKGLSFGEVTFNTILGWQLNLGALHGIRPQTNPIYVVDSQDSKQLHLATIKEVHLDFTQLNLPDGLDKDQVNVAQLEGLLSQLLSVYILNEDGLLEGQQQLLIALSNIIIAAESEDMAQYVVRCSHGLYFITYPNDPFRPLAAPIKASEPRAPITVAQQVKHIAQWEYRKHLRNADTANQLDEHDYQIEINEVLTSGNPKPLNIHEDEVSLTYEKMKGKWQSALQVRITNKGEDNLYCCVLLLGSNFNAFLNYLSPTVYPLEPSNSVDLKIHDNSTIVTSIQGATYFYNWPAEIEYLLFVISKDPFEAQALALEKLPSPLTLSASTEPTYKGSTISRGADTGDEIATENKSGWTTRCITIRHLNPEYNLIRESELRTRLTNPLLADFILGLYFEASIGPDRLAKHELKPHIQLIEDSIDTDKGLLGDSVLDIANWWARQRRNQRYQDVITQFPNRLRIVSEGDSWFEHPLVLDIIDHLSKVYAVYCVAAAGDTLRNYMSEAKNNGEYYLDAIEEQKPAFFLISGGGNDILGAKFKSFLQDQPDLSLPEGVDTKRFLKQSLWNEINSLMEIYKTWFGYLSAYKPHLQIIVHGYDYPVKLDEPHKGWLGRYMLEKGISAVDRKAIIHLIMDHFNEQLQTVSRAFTNVSYIDVRGTVRYNPGEEDQWYDEIHPNGDGFQQIAMKFIQQITLKSRKQNNEIRSLKS